MSSVQITPPPISEQSMADLLCTIMVLCQANDEKGNPFWAYMCIKPSMAKSFKEARESGAMELENFGTILESGKGRDVPTEIKTRMERDYGANHHFEQDLINAIEVQKNRL